MPTSFDNRWRHALLPVDAQVQLMQAAQIDTLTNPTPGSSTRRAAELTRTIRRVRQQYPRFFKEQVQ